MQSLNGCLQGTALCRTRGLRSEHKDNVPALLELTFLREKWIINKKNNNLISAAAKYSKKENRNAEGGEWRLWALGGARRTTTSILRWGRGNNRLNGCRARRQVIPAEVPLPVELRATFSLTALLSVLIWRMGRITAMLPIGAAVRSQWDPGGETCCGVCSSIAS